MSDSNRRAQVVLGRWRSLLGVVILAASVGSGCAQKQSEPSKESPARQASASAPAAAAGKVGGLESVTRGWELGREYPYRVTLSTILKLGETASAFDFDLQGDLAVVTTAVTPESAVLFATLREPKVVSRVPGTAAEFTKLADQLGRSGCFATLVGGRVSELRFAPNLSPLVVSIYRDLVARLQFSRSVTSAAEYEAEEHDGTGRYVAKYTRAEGSSSTFHRTKLKYLSILASKVAGTSLPSGIIPQVVTSESTIELASDGRPMKLRATDEVLVRGAQAPMRSKTSVSFEPGAPKTHQPIVDWVGLAASMQRIAADEPYGSQATLDALDDARINRMSFETIVSKLAEIAESNDPGARTKPTLSDAERSNLEKSVGESSKYFVALAATFRRHPETVTRALSKVRGNSAAKNSIIDALGSSGSEAAHRALAKLVESKTAEPKLKARALAALARTPRPTDASTAALRALLRDDPFNMDALYGLGTHARKLRDSGQTEKASELGQVLSERLRMAGETEPHLITVLGGITNSGSDLALGGVERRLADPRDNIRAAAVRALQSMRDPKIDSLIAARIENDTSSDVLISAMDGARVREPSAILLRALEKAVAHDDPRVRYRAVDLMIEWKPKRPELRQSLSRVAANDAEPRVRDRARAAL